MWSPLSLDVKVLCGGLKTSLCDALFLGANSAMQTVHGVPLPIYRAFELLNTAGNVTVPVTINGKDPSLSNADPLTVMATVVGAASSSTNDDDRAVVDLAAVVQLFWRMVRCLIGCSSGTALFLVHGAPYHTTVLLVARM